MQFLALVDIDDDEESVEGHYFAGQFASLMKLLPSDAVCPFCRSAMEELQAPRLGRILRQQGERQGGKISAVIEMLPASHEALKCIACEAVMSRVREESGA